MSKLKVKIDIMRRQISYAHGVDIPSDTVHVWLDGYPDKEVDARLLAEQIEHRLTRALPRSAMALHIDYGSLNQSAQPELAVREMIERGEMSGRHLVLVTGPTGLGVVKKVSQVVFERLMENLTPAELEDLRAQLASQLDQPS